MQTERQSARERKEGRRAARVRVSRARFSLVAPVSRLLPQVEKVAIAVRSDAFLLLRNNSHDLASRGGPLGSMRYDSSVCQSGVPRFFSKSFSTASSPHAAIQLSRHCAIKQRWLSTTYLSVHARNGHVST